MSVHLCLNLQLSFSYYFLYSIFKASEKAALRHIINNHTLELMGTNKEVLRKILPSLRKPVVIQLHSVLKNLSWSMQALKCSRTTMVCNLFLIKKDWHNTLWKTKHFQSSKSHVQSYTNEKRWAGITLNSSNRNKEKSVFKAFACKLESPGSSFLFCHIFLWPEQHHLFLIIPNLKSLWGFMTICRHKV